MARVLTLGGVFFKSPDPQRLYEWYHRWLGIPHDWQYGLSFKPDAMPPGGFNVWSAFKADTDYFDPGSKDFMMNLVVDDVDGALAQVKEGGAQIVGEIQREPYGDFGWFIDPDGNKVELWKPKV